MERAESESEALALLGLVLCPLLGHSLRRGEGISEIPLVTFGNFSSRNLPMF